MSSFSQIPQIWQRTLYTGVCKIQIHLLIYEVQATKEGFYHKNDKNDFLIKQTYLMALKYSLTQTEISIAWTLEKQTLDFSNMSYKSKYLTDKNLKSNTKIKCCYMT